MTVHKFALAAAAAGVGILLLAAQSSMAQAPGRTPIPGTPGTTGVPTTHPGNRTTNSTRQRQEPCWQVAGISHTAMQQRHTLAQQARQEVEAVCANSSLSMTQKRERIREIRQQERQQIEALITPQQQATLRTCQQERGHGGHMGGGGHGGGHGGGPCGTMPGFENNEMENEPSPKD